MTTAIGAYATAGALKQMIGTTDSDDDDSLALVCDRINQYIETQTGQPVCPISSTTYTYDVYSDNATYLWLPGPNNAPTKYVGGARTVTLVEFAPYTGGTWATVTAGDYLLRSRATVTGPYRYLYMSDKPVGQYRTFRRGLTVRVTGTWGWDAIPDDLTEAALIAAQRSWNAKAIGNQDIAGVDELAKFFTGRERATLRKYTARPLP